MKLPAVFAVTVSFFTAVAKDRPADIAAKEAFARLENAAVPTPQLSYDCALTQLEVMKKGNSQRRAVLPRDAYCRFLLAVTANDSGALQQAPGLLEKAAGDGRSNMAPLLAVLAALARHDAGALPTAIARVNCAKTDFVAPATCRRILDAAYIWTGGFERVPNTPWQAWARAQAQLEARQWSDAVTSLSEAAEPELASLTTLLAPKFEVAQVYSKLALAQFMLLKFDAAIGTLDRAIAHNPNDANSLFLRARIREELDLPAPALIDLQAAAEADPHSQAAAVLLLRQGKPQEASQAFNALPATVPDLAAWKLLAQGCSDELLRAAASASPLFPKREAVNVCVEQATTLEKLMALETSLPRIPELCERVSNLYLKFGLAAEDKQDSASAVTAYRRALDWSPSNTRARFNLAALYIGDSKFEQAESEYRPLLAADPNDHESQFWLAQIILVTKPDAGRRSEACALLEGAIQIQDPAKPDQFAAVAARYCAH